jgi:hypothetical protein
MATLSCRVRVLMRHLNKLILQLEISFSQDQLGDEEEGWRQQFIAAFAWTHSVVSYWTALSVRAVQMVRTSFEVLSCLQAEGVLSRHGTHTVCGARALCPVPPSGHDGLPSMSVSPHRPVLDAEPVNIRRLRHEGLGSIPGQYVWDLWGT